jgi:hypothetical protein
MMLRLPVMISRRSNALKPGSQRLLTVRNFENDQGEARITRLVAKISRLNEAALVQR